MSWSLHLEKMAAAKARQHHMVPWGKCHEEATFVPLVHDAQQHWLHPAGLRLLHRLVMAIAKRIAPEAPQAWGTHFSQTSGQCAGPLLQAACLSAWQMHAAHASCKGGRLEAKTSGAHVQWDWNRRWTSLSVCCFLFFFCYLAVFVYGLVFLVAPYCAIPRDYLSDTPLLRAMGFLVSQHGQLGAIPPPPFLSVSPLESMRSGGAIRPPQRGISAILARYPMKTRQMGAIPPSAILSRKGIAR